MPGLSLKVGGFGGVGPNAAGNAAPGTGPASYSAAAFGPGYTAAGPSGSASLVPNDGFGAAFWAGVVAIVALAVVRHSLPG
jgi:hypothetical protein